MQELALVLIDCDTGRCVRFLCDGKGHFPTTPNAYFAPADGCDDETIEEFRMNRRHLPAQPPKEIA